MKPAKVIKIIDSYSVVVNIGIEDSIKEGDICLIYSIGEELFDPDTKESLGALEVVKGKGKVTHVQPKISTIKSIDEKRTRSILRPTLGGGINLIFGGREEETFETVIEPFQNIALGDFVKKIR